ncbi:MAG: malonate transporter subunit MadL [Sphingomonadales bacterium]
MPIYGVALLAACTLVGLFAGDVIGAAMGLKANVGGVGIAMLLLMALANLPGRRIEPASATGSGIQFWNVMYIPIIVAMAARQNVVAAVSGGSMAILAGVLAVLAGFVLVPWLSRVAQR